MHCGMSETDIKMSFKRHATSKIRKSEDLFCIKTMGFRGEHGSMQQFHMLN